MSEHVQVPADAKDGDEFTCPHCGVTMIYVVLEDGYAEWVTVSES